MNGNFKRNFLVNLIIKFAKFKYLRIIIINHFFKIKFVNLKFLYLYCNFVTI